MDDTLKYFHAHSEERFKEIITEAKKDEYISQQLPGLANLLNDYVRPDVDVSHEDYVRRFLKVFKDSTTDGTYSQVLGSYHEDESSLIRAFVEDNKSARDCGDEYHLGLSLPAREKLPNLDPRPHGLVKKAFEHIHDALERTVHDVHIFDDSEGKNKVTVYFEDEFVNWGQTVSNVPKITCVPQTSYGIQQIVKFAQAHDMNVRTSGYRHSWSPVFAKNGQILISTLGLHRASRLPNIESLPGSEFFHPETE
jgi:hypothetical protein